VECIVPECRWVTLEDKPRRAFRCYGLTDTVEFKPLSWTAKDLGLSENEQSYPVFIQKHAVEQWTKRLPEALVGYRCLSDSLADPVFVHSK
jgi:hypothetical protein